MNVSQDIRSGSAALMNASERIGAESGERIENFAGLVSGLRQTDYPEIDRAMMAALERLHAASTRISVVGQVKAGKSSLINALTGLRDFLPTEVNPWTAVITNLHFGAGNGGRTGGVFKLFGEDEWHRMIDGNAETRKLAEELLPGFKTDILKQQVAKMQADAKRRLGGMYRHLLGKEHSFNTVTREVLERYVSAGFSEGVNPDSSAGKFSGITKSAEIFLPSGPFEVPVTLSDTPGINDPFLVRDEITTSSFREADIFIVALSAHQPLNTADIALLKMLSVHSGKKTVIFVNRIDELADPAADLPGMVESLDERLRQELASPNYLIICGSAALGSLVSSGSDEEVAETAGDPRFEALWRASGGAGDAPPRDRLFRISGMEELARALSKLIAEGPGRFALSQAAAEVSSALGLLTRMLRDQVRQDHAGIGDAADFAAVLRQEKDRITARRGVLDQVSEQLGSRSDAARERLLENAAMVTVTVEKTIDLVVTGFIEDQLGQLRESLKASAAASWSLDTAAIRETIETRVRQAYAAARESLDSLLVSHVAKFHEVIAPVAGALPTGPVTENLPHDEILPGFKPNSTMIDIELRADRGWQFWRSARMTEAEAADTLRRVIRSELFAAVSSLKISAAEAIAERTGAGLQRLDTALAAAAEVLQSEIGQLDGELGLLAEDGGTELLDRIRRDRGARIDELRRRLVKLEQGRSEIEAIVPEAASMAVTDGRAEVA